MARKVSAEEYIALQGGASKSSAGGSSERRRVGPDEYFRLQQAKKSKSKSKSAADEDDSAEKLAAALEAYQGEYNKYASGISSMTDASNTAPNSAGVGISGARISNARTNYRAKRYQSSDQYDNTMDVQAAIEKSVGKKRTDLDKLVEKYELQNDPTIQDVERDIDDRLSAAKKGRQYDRGFYTQFNVMDEKGKLDEEASKAQFDAMIAEWERAKKEEARKKETSEGKASTASISAADHAYGGTAGSQEYIDAREAEALTKAQQRWAEDAAKDKEYEAILKDLHAQGKRAADYYTPSSGSDAYSGAAKQRTERELVRMEKSEDKRRAMAGYQSMQSQPGYKDVTVPEDKPDPYANIGGVRAFGGSDQTPINLMPYMTQDERQLHEYIRLTRGDAEAEDFLHLLDNDLQSRYTAAEVERIEKRAETRPVVASAASVFENIPAAVSGGVYTLAQAAKNEYINPTAIAYAPELRKTAARETVSKDMSGIGSFLYNTGMSMSEFLSLVPLGSKGASAVLGTGAFQSTAREATEKGADLDQAVKLGAVAGAAEIITEKIGMDRLFGIFKEGRSIGMRALHGLVVNGFPEAGEEMITEVVNTIADMAIMGSDSEWTAEYDALIKAGVSPKDAEKQVMDKVFKNVAIAGAGGLLSGAIIGGGASMIGNVANNIDTGARLHQTARENAYTGNAIDGAYEAAKSSSPWSKEARVARTNANIAVENQANGYGDAESGGRRSLIDDFRAGNAYNNALREPLDATMQAINADVDQTVTTNRQADAKNAMYNVLYGGTISDDDAKMVIDNPAVRSIFQTLTGLTLPENPDVDHVKLAALAGRDNVNYTAHKAPAETEAAPAQAEQSPIAAATTAPAAPGAQAAAETASSDIASAIPENATAQPAAVSKTMPAAATVESTTSAAPDITGVRIDQATPAATLQEYYARSRQYAEQAQTSITDAVQSQKGAVRFGVVNKRNLTGTLTDQQKSTVRALDHLSAAANINIELHDTFVTDGQLLQETPNGYYDRATGTLHLAMDAENNIVLVASHELTHFIQQWSPVQYENLKDYIRETYDGQEAGRMDLLVRKKMASLQAAGRENVTYAAAEDEVIADACEMFLADGDAISRLAKKNRTLGRKIAEFIRRMLKDLAAALRGVDATSEEAVQLKENVSAFQRAQELWTAALEEAAEAYRYTGGMEIGKAGETHRYSFREYSSTQKKNWESSNRIVVYESQQQFSDFIDDAISHKNIDRKVYFGQVSGELGKRIEESTGISVDGYNCSLQAQEILKILKKHGNDEVESKSGQRGITKEDILSIPSVILSADQITLSDEKYDGKPVIVFRTTNNTWTEVVAVVSDKHLDLRVQTMYGGKNKSLATPTDAFAPAITSKTPHGTALGERIPQSEDAVNGIQFSTRRTNKDSAGNDLTEEQAVFFADSKIRDADGKLKVVYHGSRSNFNIFDRSQSGKSNTLAKLGYWFTESGEGAKNFANSVWYGDDESAQVYSVYLNIKNPKVYESADNRSAIDEQKAKYDPIDTEMTALDSTYYFKDWKRYHYKEVYSAGSVKDVSPEAWDAFRAIVKGYDQETVDYYLSQLDAESRENVERDAQRYRELFQERKRLDSSIDDLRYSDAYEHFRSDVYREDGQTADGANFGGIGKSLKDPENTLEKFEERLKREGYDGIVIRNTTYDGEKFGSANTQYVAFDSEQIKRIDNKAPTGDPDIRHSTRSGAASPRELLADALMPVVANEEEARRLAEYRRGAKRRDEAAAKLAKIKEELHEAGFTAGHRNDARIAELHRQQKVMEDFVDRFDKRLLNLEATKPLRDLVARERSRAAQKATKDAAANMQQYKENTKERTEAKKTRERIEKNTRDLSNWLLRPTDAKHVPESFRKVTADFLSTISFDIASRDTKKAMMWRDKLRDIGDAMRRINDASSNQDYSGFYADIDPDFLARLDEFISGAENVQSIAELSNDQLKGLDMVLGIFKKCISESDAAKANAKYKTISEVGNAAMGDMARYKEKKHAAAKMIAAIDSTLNIDQLDSFAYFHELGPAAESILTALRKGSDKRVRNIQKGMDFMSDLLKDTDIRKWSGENAEAKTFTVAGGEIKLTVAQVMELYELNKRGQAQDHIYKGGIKIDDVTALDGKRKAKIGTKTPVYVTENDIAAITLSLTEKQKAVADAMQAFMGKECAAWGNETSMDMYGYLKFTSSHYYPIKVDRDSTKTISPESNVGLWALKNIGQTKQTIDQAQNALIVGDIFDTFTKHVDEMASYNGLVVPLSDAMKWFNYRDPEAQTASAGVKQSIGRIMGQKGQAYFVNLLKDINGISRASYGTELASRLIGNVKVAAVSFNLRVVLQQPTAYVRAAAVIDPKYLLQGRCTKASMTRMLEHSAIATWKSWGFFDTNLGVTMRDVIVGDQSVADKFREAGLWAAGKADDITWASLWSATEAEIKATRKDLQVDSDEYFEAVSDRFSEIIDKTQVVDTVFHKSQMMRSKDFLVKDLTSFMAEPTKTYNMLRSAAVDAARGDRSAKARFARVATVYFATGIVTAAAASVADAFRDDDEDKTFWEKYKAACLGNVAENANPLTLLPVFSDILSLIDGYSQSSLMFSGIEAVINSAKAWEKYINGTSKYTLYGLTSASVKALSKLTGIPAGNILRTFESLYGAIAQERIPMKTSQVKK